MSTEKFTRLPQLAKPTLYSIRLKLDVEKFVCHGQETIDVEIIEQTNVIVLNSHEIRIDAASVRLADGTEVDLIHVLDTDWQQLFLKFPQKVAPQKVLLKLRFEAVLNDKMQGFYRSTYKDPAGTQKHLFASQFASTYARQCFPCWDEPIYKAKFDIALEVPQRFTALSNMNVVSETATDSGMKLVKYVRTPLMSTYLVAFVVGELEYNEIKTSGGIPIRVYTTAGKKQNGEFALSVAKKALEYHAEWFGIPYPLPKCDLVAVPDFQFGAMENWGLVTYREITLLVDPKQSSTLTKTNVALTVGHELAHFWFGNLVTMKWWTDLWLNEGFASYFAFMFVGATYPEYKVWLHFVKDEVARGFELDSLRSSHPIEVEINDPAELEDIFDAITYAKADSVIRMLCNYLGEQTFQSGMRSYLRQFQYGNATTVDLWQAFGEVSGKDIRSLMSSWTRQTGFPLISVEQKVHPEKRAFKLKQKRFLCDGGKDELQSTWQIPILVSTGANPSHTKEKFLLTKPEQVFLLEGVKPDEWVKFNASTTGFYRVHYSEKMFIPLFAAIASQDLPVLDRFGVACDLFALVESGHLNAARFLEFVQVCGGETEFVVWSALDDGLGALANVLSHHSDPKLRQRFDAFVCKVLAPVGERYGWEPKSDEDPQTGILRGLVLSRLSKCGHKPTVATAVAKFYDHIEKASPLVADLRSAVFSTVGRTEGRKGIEALKKVFETCGFSEVERQCVVALGQATEPELLKEVFHYGVLDGKIRPQDLMSLFAGSGGSKQGQGYAWSFIKTNFRKLSDLFGGASARLFQRCIKLSVARQASSAVAKEFEAFFKANVDAQELQGLGRPIRQVTESIRLNELLLKRNVKALEKFLQDQAI